ncbi:actyltransferase-like protein, partial [Trypanosoma grayi]|uniref:actyltransferase-like protein n=1 Tax=Trypanosoma grayi TaxID=71804 RepID=UPI0004F4B278
TPAGAARLRVLTHCGAHTHAKPVVKIERVCVLQEYRGKGCGTALIRALEAYARDMLHSPALILHARVNSKEFYTRLGYSAKSEVYMEAGKQHLTMAKL